LFFQKINTPGLAIFSYMVADPKTKKCAVIDPTRDVNKYLEIARQNNLVITDILETHVHADFVSGSRELKNRLGEDPTIHCSGMGGKEWTPTYADHIVHDADEVILGDIRLKAIHTPGHTSEHIVWAIFDDRRSSDAPCMLFSGDFLLVGDVGRPDLLGKEAQLELSHQLYKSIFEVLPKIPDFTEVYPAHGAGSMCAKTIGSRDSSSVGYEKQFNMSLKPMPEEEWTRRLMEGMPPPPPYFRRMKKVNVEGPSLLGTAPYDKLRAFTPSELNDLIHENCLVVDARSKESFASIHIPGSINIPLAPNFASWSGWILPYDKPIVLVLEDEGQLEEGVKQLYLVGYDKVEGYLKNGISSWENDGLKTSHLGVLSVQELHEKLSKQDPSFLVIDVRTDGEWKSGHIQGALHHPVGTIPAVLNQLPKDKELVVACGTGYRASIAASILKREGFEKVTNLMGGMTAWYKERLPIEK